MAVEWELVVDNCEDGCRYISCWHRASAKLEYSAIGRLEYFRKAGVRLRKAGVLYSETGGWSTVQEAGVQ